MSNTSYPFQENKNNVMHAQGGEKKVMKKILSVALSTAMAFSMFASVAFGDTAKLSTQEKFDALKVKGIFAGDTDGLAHLERDMTRAEFAKVITKVMGLKEVTGTYSYNDAGYNNPKNWAAPFIEAVSAAGVMQGKDLTKKLFDQKANVTVQELAEVLVKAMKLEIPTKIDNSATEWAKGSVQAAINAGLLSKDLNFQANANRSLLVEAAFAAEAALNVPPVTTATKVEKVSATNLKEVEVAFDGTVDSVSAERADYYSTTAGSIKHAVVAEDGKSVRLTLADGVVLTNNKEYKLTLSNIKAGDKVISSSDIAFTVVDNALPEVTSVTSLGNKAIKVVVSEPVKNISQANFKLDGVPFYGSVTVGGTAREIILKPYASNTIAIGEHKLTVSLLEDYYNLKSLTKEVSFTVAEDKEGPTVTEAKATLETVTLTFNEDIDPDSVKASDVYWLSGSTKKYAESYAKIAGNKYAFTFKAADVLPTYETTLYVDSVSDYSGNANTVKEVKVTAAVDQVRPEVINVKLNDDKKNVEVKFNKNVTVDKSKFVITDKDGKVQSIRSVSGTGTKVATIELYNTLSEDNTYTLKASGIQDTTALKNVLIDYSTTISVGDKTGPSKTGASANELTRTVVVTFDEKLDQATALSHSSYYIHFDNVDRQLPSDVQITPTLDGKGVYFVFPAKIGNSTVTFTANSLSQLKLVGLKDLKGNVMEGYSDVVDLVAAKSLADVATSYSSSIASPAAFTDKNTVKVKFNQPIDSVDKDAFEFANGATIKDATADGSNFVTITLNTNDTRTDFATTLKVVAGRLINTATGIVAVNNPSIAISDQVKPETNVTTTKLTVTAAGTIDLPFTEVVTGGNPSDYAKDLVVTKLKANGTDGLLLADVDYTTTASTNTVTIHLKNTVTNSSTSAYSVKVKSSASYIKDLNGNTAEESSTYETNELTAVGKLTAATNAVVTAETTPTQANVNSAQSLINALPAAEQVALQARLDAVQNIITTAKLLAEAKTEANVVISDASVLADAAVDGTDPGEYSAANILLYTKAIATAKNAVKDATTVANVTSAVDTLKAATVTFKASVVPTL